jgi:quercetin dioxygenase-like cupin family protein
MSGSAAGRERVVRFDASAQRFAREKLQKVPLFAGPNFFLDLYCLEPGQNQKPHAHLDSAKVYLVLEGSACATLGTQELTLGAGEAVMAAPGEPHGIRNDSQQRAVVLTFMAPPPR